MNNIGGGLMGQALQGLGSLPYGGYYPRDTRTNREKLESKLNSNISEINRLTSENEELTEALMLLDDHPMIEKMNNLIHKLVG